MFETRKFAAGADSFGRNTQRALADILARGDMDGKAGTTLLLHNVPALPAERLLIVGLGKEKEFRDKEYCAAIRTAVKALKDTGTARRHASPDADSSQEAERCLAHSPGSHGGQ